MGRFTDMVGDNKGVVGCSCGCSIIVISIGVVIGVCWHIDGCCRNRQKEMISRQEKIEADKKEDARRSFALRESPVLWRAIESLKADIDEQNLKLAKLETTFADLGMDKDADSDYIAMVGERDEMVKKLRLVEDELDQAYLASVKYEVTRGKAQKCEFECKAENDGISEASLSRRKYEDLRREK